MTYTITPASESAFIPLSAEYNYDDKVSLNATLHQYTDGYSFFHHPIFSGSKDVTFANDSFFGITSSASFKNLVNDVSYIDPLELVIFMALKARNGKYITNTDNTLYATATSIGPDEFFKLVRNADGTCSLSQDDLYATVDIVSHSFVINMEAKNPSDPNSVQKFVFDTGGSGDNFTIKSLFTIPEWSPTFTAPIERYWSYYDDTDSNIIKTIGMIPDDDYIDDNRYLFEANVDLDVFAIGFDGNIIWVKYYNDTLTKFFNRNVDIKDIIEDVTQNYLVEYPYKTKIDITNFEDLVKTGSIKINIANLKNILTPEYEVAVKKE